MCIDTIRRLRDAVRRKRPEKWKTNNWFLLHDNAPAHRSVMVKHFLEKTVTTPEHPRTALTCLHLIFTSSTEISIEGTVLFLILLTSL